jgi:hypothetical protein
MPSSPTYPTGETNLPPPQRKRGRKGLVTLLVIAVIVVLVGGGLGGFYFYTSYSKQVVASQSTPTVGVTATPVATSAPATPTVGTTATSVPTTSTTVTPGGISSSYTATQPGPGCDTNGGTWTPQGISKITCGTTIYVNTANSRGYLYLQLPNNKAFSSNNNIGISGTLQNYGDSVGNCVGLAEQDANTGFLVEYCNDGRWYIYSISSGGAIVKTLDKNITSTRTSEQISLTLKGTTLSFSIDSEIHTVSISPIQPTKVAITFFAGGGGESVPITNFSYTAS